MACYLDCLPLEAGLGPGATTWGGLLTHFDGLFRRLVLLLSTLEDVTTSLLRIMVSILKVQGIQQNKGILDPFSKVLSYAIQNSTIKYSYLTDLCYLCHRGFPRDRDKHVLARTIVFELVQAMKFKTTIPDNNFLLLLHFVLQVRFFCSYSIYIFIITRIKNWIILFVTGRWWNFAYNCSCGKYSHRSVAYLQYKCV